MTTDYNLRERELRARPGRFDATDGSPDAAPGRVGVAGRQPRSPIPVSRPSGAGVRMPTYSGDEARLLILATSPTMIEEEVDRRLSRFYSEGGTVQLPTDEDELAFRRKQVRDTVWQDVTTLRNRDGGASAAQFGIGLISGVASTAYRPFASVAGFLSGESPEDSIHQAWQGLLGDDPFSKQGRNIGFVRLLPDADFLPFGLSVRDVAGGAVDLGIDTFMTARISRLVRGTSAATRLGVKPASSVADLPTIREFAEDVGGNSRLTRAVNRAIPIDPSTLLDTDLGRVALGYKRAEVAGEGLTQVALAPLDSWARRFTGRAPVGRNGWLFKMDRDGFLTNVARNSGDDATSLAWNDVFSNPGRYALTQEQRQYVDDVIHLVDDVDQMRVRAGLPSRAKDTSPEGWFYVPRTVTEIDDLRVSGRTLPAQERKYEEMAQGMAAGVRYETDVRAVLESHIRNAYNEVNYNRLVAEVKEQAINPARVQPGGEFARVRTPEAMAARSQLGGVMKSFRGTVDDISAATTVDDAAVDRVTDLGERVAQLREAAAETERIRVGRWREFVLPQEVAEEMNRIAPPAAEAVANWINRGFQSVGDAIRFNSAVGDFAAPFLQGYPLLFRDPASWARSTALSYMSFLDPTVMSRHMRDNLHTYQQMAQHGVPVGDNEFFAALARGRNTNVFGLMQNMVRRLPANIADNPDRVLGTMRNQTYGRFQATYDTFLAAGRSMMWDGLSESMTRNGGDLFDVARHIRNMTGGLDTRALGVSANQRGFESTWLAFAPRYTRSVGALAAEMFDANPAIRSEAIRSVASTLGGTVALFVATGIALGKSEEEIIDSLLPVEINGRGGGKQFLSFQMGDGDWVGVGGTVRSLTQTIAAALSLGNKVITDPASVKELGFSDLFDSNSNPFLRFAAGRAAPGQTLLRALIETASGGTVDTLPFEELNSLPDLTAYLGRSTLPFAVQGRLEGESLSTTAFAVGGLRTSAETPSERKEAIRDLAVRAAGMGDTYKAVEEELGSSAAAQRVREWLSLNDPAALAEFDRIEQERFDQYRRDRAVRNDPVATGILAGVDARDSIAAFIEQNPDDLQAIREEASRLLRDARAIREQPQIKEALEGLPGSDSEASQDVERYFEVIDNDNATIRDEAEAALRQELGPERWSRVLANVFAVSQPMPDQWRRIQDGKRVLTESGFFDQSEPSWSMIQRALRGRIESADPETADAAMTAINAGSFQDWYDSEIERQTETLVEQGWDEVEARTRAKNIAQRHPITQGFDQAMLFNRITWARQHPDEARVAYQLGYLQGSDTNTVISGVLPDEMNAAPTATATPQADVPTEDIVSAYREGKNYAQIAEEFGLSEEAVRSRIRRAARGRPPESLRETDQ